MNELERSRQNPTDKTREELLNTPWEELNSWERILKPILEQNPHMTLKMAIDSKDMVVHEKVEKFVKRLREMPYDLSKVGQSFVTFLPRKK